ncbi:MAG TPA: TRAP transporter TatT component family protein, partial [Anaeromyxobacter sp.]|nr:TRAP transporter TatT component family protein [Anaeromyxobacter sp.]
MERVLSAIAISLLAAGATGCKTVVVSYAAGAASSTGTTYASDDDPELVREAIPFGLKTMESLLHENPRHAGLLLAACQGFTQYAYAFV